MPQPAVREPLSPWPIAGLVGLACVAVAWFTSRPRLVVLLPVVVALVWFATVVGGARWLGWSA